MPFRHNLFFKLIVVAKALPYKCLSFLMRSRHGYPKSFFPTTLFFITVFFNCFEFKSQNNFTGNFGIGTTFGVHPNYQSRKTNGFVFSEGNFSIKTRFIPISIDYRISEEKYRSGIPSYFKIRPDLSQINLNRKLRVQNNLDSLATVSGNLDKQIDAKSDSIYNFKNKSFLINAILSTYNLKGTAVNSPKLDSLNLKKPDSLQSHQLNVGNHDLHNPELPNNPITGLNFTTKELDSLKALKSKIDASTKTLEAGVTEVQTKKTETNELYKKFAIDYQKWVNFTSPNFFQGLKRVELGLGSPSIGGMSGNSVPIQGIHVEGEYKKYFYDFAAGFTMPNQLFSTQIFEQVVNNTSNNFNQNNFFNQNTVRFLSSSILGAGTKDEKAISIENHYLGRTWEELKKRKGGLISFTQNISAINSIKRKNPLLLSFSLGYTHPQFRDSIKFNAINRIAYSGEIQQIITKVKGKIGLKYRRLGDGYDGWSQGLQNNGVIMKEISYRQQLSKRGSAGLRWIDNLSDPKRKDTSSFHSAQVAMDAVYKVTNKLILSGNYAILRFAQNWALLKKTDNSQVFGIQSTHRQSLGKNSYIVNQTISNYAKLFVNDTTAEIQSHSHETRFDFEVLSCGVKVGYQNYKGLSRIQGDAWLVQPSISINVKKFTMRASYQYMNGSSFKNAQSYQLQFLYKLDSWLHLDFSVQRWNPIEYKYFLNTVNEFSNPLFLKWKLIWMINEKK